MSKKRAGLEQAEVEAQRLARLIAGSMPEGWRFALWLFSEGEPGFSTYVSNIERQSLVQAIRELADHLERGDKEA